jgi:hypothetical protein
MPTDRKEYMKEYMKEYNEKRKEKRKEYDKEYKEKNKEKIKQQSKEYYENNKEKIKEKNRKYDKEYSQTEAGKKSYRIIKWKSRGLKNDDYNSLYDYFINCKNCELCNVELVEGNKGNGKCLDHDHETGLFRNVLCRSCNVKRR